MQALIGSVAIRVRKLYRHVGRVCVWESTIIAVSYYYQDVWVSTDTGQSWVDGEGFPPRMNGMFALGSTLYVATWGGVYVSR
jgi:hypothetical protein